MNTQTQPTLFEWMGGQQVVDRLIDCFYRLTLGDPILRPIFQNMSQAHIKLVALWFGEVFGGPSRYSQTFGSNAAHPHMMRRHADLHISELQRARWMQLMLEAADNEKLPDDPEFRSAFVAYIEWGTRMAKLLSNGAPIPDDSPMPKWGWGESPPYGPLKP